MTPAEQYVAELAEQNRDLFAAQRIIVRVRGADSLTAHLVRAFEAGQAQATRPEMPSLFKTIFGK